MKMKGNTFLLTPAHLTGLGALQLSLLFIFIDIHYAWIPLLIFVIITFIAPFIPSSIYFLPVITRGNKKKKRVTLTFDDGPDPMVTPQVLNLLDKYQVKGCFFVMGQKAEKHGDLIDEIITRGHEIGNHSYSHSPAIMMFSAKRLKQDIEQTQNIIKAHGLTPLCFRPPRGNTNPRLWPVLHELCLDCVNFSNRAVDFGNRKIKNLAVKILKKVKAGDIILLHDIYHKDLDMDEFVKELEDLIEGIKEKGFEIVSLSENLERPVAIKNNVDDNNPVSAFYDNLARNYDEEQLHSSVSLTRSREIAIIQSYIKENITADMSVLEIGSGTGLLTESIASLCHDITALDVSQGMLQVLQEKVRRNNISNIDIVHGGIEEFTSDNQFHFICSFSSLEYVTDLEPVFQNIFKLLHAGGTFYFTTAHTSFLKFFAQIGNAMRQGLWLRSRSKTYVKRTLKKYGFRDVKVKIGIAGVLLEVEAKKE
jgi:peptidoglycan-N-acetylglucosamine deacetylase